MLGKRHSNYARDRDTQGYNIKRNGNLPGNTAALTVYALTKRLKEEKDQPAITVENVNISLLATERKPGRPPRNSTAVSNSSPAGALQSVTGEHKCFSNGQVSQTGVSHIPSHKTNTNKLKMEINAKLTGKISEMFKNKQHISKQSMFKGKFQEKK